MSRGYVYILTNESMPGLVKIGKTTRDVAQRASELNHTGVPFPFDVYAFEFSPDCNELERMMHERFADCRVNPAREFFLCCPDKAQGALHKHNLEQVREDLHSHLPDYTLQETDMALCPTVPHIMSTHVGIPSEDVVSAYEFMEPQDLLPAIKRMKDHRAGTKKHYWLKPSMVSS